MTVRTHLYDQFRRPRGPLGMLAGRIMSKRVSNRDRSAWTVDLLDPHAGDRVLELGYGPGLGIEAVASRLGRGTIVGIDHSATMRAMATRRVSRSLRHARRASHGAEQIHIDLRVGDVEHLDPDLGTFDAIFSCNVWLFWTDPVATFRDLGRHLAPGGLMAVTHLPRHGGATRQASLDAAETIAAQLGEAGFVVQRTGVLELDPVPAICVLASLGVVAPPQNKVVSERSR